MVNNIKFTNWKPFQCEVTDDSTTDIFEDDEPLGDGNAATHNMTITMGLVYAIQVQKVYHWLNPTNAVTYQIFFLADNQAVAMNEGMELIYQSEALMADSQLYIETGATDKLPTIAHLAGASIIPFKIDWSGAPGDTTGILRMEGLVLV